MDFSYPAYAQIIAKNRENVGGSKTDLSTSGDSRVSMKGSLCFERCRGCSVGGIITSITLDGRVWYQLCLVQSMQT
jgi:hypothetical protein